uniref:Uncharacterized protein n=1 Tax=Sinocyclocheilus anshuiensis TaxID=1608454 RepID=A0A671QEV0_9TELE
MFRFVCLGIITCGPRGAPLGGFCDRFRGRDGYRLHFIDTDTILLIDTNQKYRKNKLSKKMLKMSSYFITAVYKSSKLVKTVTINKQVLPALQNSTAQLHTS